MQRPTHEGPPHTGPFRRPRPGVATYGPQRDFCYKDFIPSFAMEHFDPTAWAALFRRAGAQWSCL
ncbi:alpha-L-fucosidase [Curtobacterium sp. ER1/6]|uniref:alpha-L-fucosidase n=1 Tax=Curtobacterium sp. ER1/6 TaxID=1891920 RepID=UPI001CB8FF36|nr:alpha-L-fucosidase [Curtobacterium sp. ER1/6]